MTDDTSTGGLDRRSFMALGAAATGAVLLPASPALAGRTERASGRVFRLGCGVGRPLPDSVILWTRLAPRPLELNGGMGKRSETVKWEVASDDAFANVVSRGSVETSAAFGHSVHVDVKGLVPTRGTTTALSTGASCLRSVAHERHRISDPRCRVCVWGRRPALTGSPATTSSMRISPLRSLTTGWRSATTSTSTAAQRTIAIFAPTQTKPTARDPMGHRAFQYWGVPSPVRAISARISPSSAFTRRRRTR